MIIHVYTSFPSKDPDEAKRNAIAKQSWDKQPWKDRPITRGDLSRVYQDGDAELYFIKDMFDVVSAESHPEDIIVYTNADIMIRTDGCARIAVMLQSTNAIWGSRRDFYHEFSEPIADTDYPKGIPYIGKDLFAFRVHWWQEVREHFPDMLVAREAWDAVLFTLIDRTNPPGPNEIRDIIAHKKHASVWERSENRYRLKSQKHNIGLALVWCHKFGVDPGPFGLRPA